MTYTVSGANFNKDVAAQGTSINYKENKAVKSEGVAGSFAGVVISGSVTAANDNTYEGLLKEADDVKTKSKFLSAMLLYHWRHFVKSRLAYKR